MVTCTGGSVVVLRDTLAGVDVMGLHVFDRVFVIFVFVSGSSGSAFRVTTATEKIEGASLLCSGSTEVPGSRDQLGHRVLMAGFLSSGVVV